jgi:REP element-mobilizing transposase RayT
MARPIRIEYEGAVYHVTLRGNERKPIFKTDADRERFIRTLSDSVDRFDIRLYLYCLMHNHVHLVLETPRANLSRFMHRLQTAYTVYFNRRHRRCGHLMQGRFGASLVDERSLYS